MSDQPPSKRKKSGAEFRKAKKARQHENKQLGSFMLNYLQRDDEKRESEEKRCKMLYVNNEFECFIRGSKHEKTKTVLLFSSVWFP